MSGFGHYDRTVAELEREIAVRGILIGLDWTDKARVRALANEALHCTAEQRMAMLRAADGTQKAKGEIFAFSTLMLDLLRQCAQSGVRLAGGSVWTALEAALIASASASEA